MTTTDKILQYVRLMSPTRTEQKRILDRFEQLSNNVLVRINIGEPAQTVIAEEVRDEDSQIADAFCLLTSRLSTRREATNFHWALIDAAEAFESEPSPAPAVNDGAVITLFDQFDADTSRICDERRIVNAICRHFMIGGTVRIAPLIEGVYRIVGTAVGLSWHGELPTESVRENLSDADPEWRALLDDLIGVFDGEWFRLEAAANSLNARTIV